MKKKKIKKQKATHKNIVIKDFLQRFDKTSQCQGSASNDNSSFNQPIIYVKCGTLKIITIELSYKQYLEIIKIQSNTKNFTNPLVYFCY